MRIIVLILAVVLGVVLVFWGAFSHPEILNAASQASHSLFYDKTISFNGLKVLSAEEIKKLLPLRNSSLWWRLNTTNIEAQLLRNPFVERAKVRSCEGLLLGCFYVDIEERSIDFLALVGDKVWAVGRSGGFLMPLTKNSLWEVQRVSMRKAPTVLQGLESVSPDIVSARLEFLRRAVQIVEEQSGYEVESVYLGKGELEFVFRGVTWHAVMEAPEENTQEMNLIKVETQVDRLKQILAEFRGQAVPWNKIDLAYNKIAVMKQE